MTQMEILQEFEGLSVDQQLETLRAALKIVETTIRRSQKVNGEHLPLAEAAALLLADYNSDEELTSFTVVYQ
jgi:hypothetical protein